MNKGKFNQMFDESFEIAAKQFTVTPDPTKSWENIKPRINKGRKQKLSILPYIAASFILGALAFGTPLVTSAIHPIFQTIKEIQSDVVTFIFEDRGDNANITPKTSPPDLNSIETQDISTEIKMNKRFTSWKEALPYLSFDPLYVNFIPEGYTLQDTRLFFHDNQKKSNEAILLFSNDKNNKFRVVMRLLRGNETITSAHHKDESAVEKIIINGTDAFLINFPEKTLSIEFMFKNMYVSVSGELERNEAIEISKNIN